MNPKVLPTKFWVSHKQFFKAADNQVFSTNLISKHVTIQFFPGCSLKTRVLNSELPSKDLIIGFDVFTKIPKLRLLPNGLKFKQYFQEWGSYPNLIVLGPSTESIETFNAKLISHCCANTHSEFLKKCSYPLWKNP